MPLFGLFERGSDGRFLRMCSLRTGEPFAAYPKAQATRVYQSALLAYALGGCTYERRLMPVKAGKVS